MTDSDGTDRARPPQPSAPAASNALRPADLLRAGPGLARVAAASAWRAASWSIAATVAGTTYVARRAIDGEQAASILQDAAADLRAAALHALGINDHPDPGTPPGRSASRGSATTQTADLRRRGSELMRRSNDVNAVNVVQDTHPAFARILGEITPDEARILRYLYLEGAQPAIDVRTNRPLGIGSELVAGGLNMIAEHAGCVHVDRIHLYLTNLSRLGLIEFSKEQVANPKRYQVIEAQPKVTEALKRAGRMPRMVQRSIHLNTFGAEFCRSCLPVGTRHASLLPDGSREASPHG